MKILYLTPRGEFNASEEKEDNEYIDMAEISAEVKRGIKEKYSDIEIDLPIDVLNDNGIIPDAVINSYDLYLCDLTKGNQSVLYTSGLIEGMGKPIIYFCSNSEDVIPVLEQKIHLLYSEASLNNEFRKELNIQIDRAINNPKDFKSKAMPAIKKQKAFISYSHTDKSYLDRLLVHLKPLERKGLIDIWEDTRIKSGDKWKEKIDKALNEANIAILMISADFMASDFIIDNELPPLLSQAEVKGTKVIPVIISHCRFSREPNLNRFQAVNAPSEPLSVMSDNDKEEVYDELAKDIELAIKP